MNLEKEYKATMVGLHKYMMNKEDPQIQDVSRHHTSKALHLIPKEAEAYLTEQKISFYKWSSKASYMENQEAETQV